MSFAEAFTSPRTDGFLMQKAEQVGLNPQYVTELPLRVKQMLNRLDKLGVVLANGDKRVSMLDESMMGAAWAQQHSELLQTIFENPEENQLATIQRDVIRGSLLADMGKVESVELIWLYGSLNFDQNNIEGKLSRFLMDRYGEEEYSKRPPMHLRQLPYSVAMDFHREIYNDQKDQPANEWDQKRLACDLKLKQLGFNVKPVNSREVVAGEASFHDVMTGAHLAVLDKLIEKCGIESDPEWERPIFIAKNHHISRGLVNGLPLARGENFLNAILAGQNETPSRVLSLAMIEEAVDMAFASKFRAKRSGDQRGIDARRRILDNLQQTEEEGRISRLERAALVLLVRRPGYGKQLSESVVEFVDDLKRKAKV